MSGPDFLQQRLAGLHESGTYRELPGSREGIDFWSNDYLGFSRCLTSAAASYNTAPGSRLISGDSEAITQLEQRIATFHGFDSALLFGSGYTANLGLLSCIARRTDTIVYDALIHASIRDGIRLSGAAARRCKHNDLKQAERVLSSTPSSGNLFFVTEARFSMGGTPAPLNELAALCRQYGAHLIVDEAHSIGIDGPNGAGLTAELGLQDSIFAAVMTYGKAPGASGAAVLGSTALRDYLINFSRPFIFTTAPRPEQLAHIESAYDLLSDRQPAVRQILERNISFFRQRIVEVGFGDRSPELTGPVQIIRPAEGQDVIAAERALLSAGLLVKGIRPPSVARGEERVRICLHAFNTREEIDRLVSTLQRSLIFSS
ncbi:8-amino-7-oxononanoate synthase [Lewinella aquimaris]|uniref:8-amino-7-oxononanoate synthase n=1 Tax=Neolewinella aquimaris TaxID=1835722 RepID=A0A840DY71_9BACT|nr:pyridoxal phosphate-dependent aminotransferase family protein [Neolewinella aquimaris]MBB4077870.1 8-amino-7-oxononanoate synthase [Neolewinella aquimaris]